MGAGFIPGHYSAVPHRGDEEISAGPARVHLKICTLFQAALLRLYSGCVAHPYFSEPILLEIYVWTR